METQELVKLVGSLTVDQLTELTAALEKEFNVSSAAAAVPSVISVVEEKVAEQTIFTVHLVSFGASKLNAVKALRVLLPELGLKEAMDLINQAPCVIKADIEKNYADQIVKALTDAGCTVEMK